MDMTRRRTVFALALNVALAAVALATQAQPVSKVARVGWLAAPAAAGNADFVEGFRDGLRQLGYSEGRNVVIEFRFADGQIDRLPRLALELANLRVDAIVVVGSQAAVATKHVTATIPIVMVSVGDPLAAGLVATCRTPAQSAVVSTATATRDEVARVAHGGCTKGIPGGLPRRSQQPPVTDLPGEHPGSGSVARRYTVQFFPVAKPDDVEPQLTAMSRAGVQGFIVAPNPVPRTRRSNPRLRVEEPAARDVCRPGLRRRRWADVV